MPIWAGVVCVLRHIRNELTPKADERRHDRSWSVSHQAFVGPEAAPVGATTTNERATAAARIAIFRIVPSFLDARSLQAEPTRSARRVPSEHAVGTVPGQRISAHMRSLLRMPGEAGRSPSSPNLRRPETSQRPEDRQKSYVLYADQIVGTMPDSMTRVFAGVAK